MKVGIIGCGVVGDATAKGLQILAHTVICHDPKLNTAIESVIDTDVVFICVPSPSLTDGSCDTRIVEQTVSELDKFGYAGIIAIKSTVVPGLTQKLIVQYKNLDICFVPEFLRERTALEDFVKNHKVLAVGCASDRAWHRVCEVHAWLPIHTVRMTPTEAEILKYYSNAIAAVKVTFANVMYEVCDKFNSNYNTILDTYLLREIDGSDYLQCASDMRGYGGMCLPKDINAMSNLCRQLELPFNLFETISHDNSQVKQTVFPGMRN